MQNLHRKMYCHHYHYHAIFAVNLLYCVCFSPGSSMDFYVSFGGLALVATVLIRGVDPDWGSVEEVEIACQVSQHTILWDHSDSITGRGGGF